MRTFKLLFLLVFGLTLATKATSLDSLGLKKENSKTYIVYKVGPKQNLFSILKKYNLSLTEFKQVNPEINVPVSSGEIIFIPVRYLDESTSALLTVAKAPEKAPVTESSTTSGIHIVAAKQSLLTVANMYKVTMAELRKWNNLTTDVLKEGQRLQISAAASIDKSTLMPNKSADPVKVDENIANNEGLRKTIETGIAELIDVPDNSGKYLALHKSAPIGTLVLVKNLANSQSIWVKVIGRLPNTDGKLIIKLSPKAFERLNAVDKRIRAEISYLIQ
jgi:LysM repeat protein